MLFNENTLDDNAIWLWNSGMVEGTAAQNQLRLQQQYSPG